MTTMGRQQRSIATIWRVAHIRVGPRHRTDLGDVGALAESIAAVGLLHAPVVSPDGQLIAGERRLAAVKRLGWETVPVSIAYDLDDALRLLIAERDENTQRKSFNPSEMVVVANDLEPLERAAVRAREEQWRGRPKKDAKFAPIPDGLSSLAKVAAAVGVSRPTLVKAKEVVQAAALDPVRFASLVAEMDRTGRVDGVYRKLMIRRQADRLESEPPPLPRGRFRVIVADPPWPYEKRTGDVSQRGAIPYPAMTLADIQQLDVAGLAAEDAILWLWTTNAHLPVAFDVLTAWGFHYKTALTWVKNRIGVGDWLRGQTEHCLLAVRGRPLVMLKSESTVLLGKVRDHSRKPAEFYRLVERLCPGSKLELFSREHRPGWHSWGLTSDKAA